MKTVEREDLMKATEQIIIRFNSTELELNKLAHEIDNLKQTILKDYEKYIPIIDEYLDIDLDKIKQKELYKKLDCNNVTKTLKYLNEYYDYMYTKEKDSKDNWSILRITKKDNTESDDTKKDE